MTQDKPAAGDSPTSSEPIDEPNLLPGPTDRGGQGGMATREGRARDRLEERPGERLQAAPATFNEQNAVSRADDEPGAGLGSTPTPREVLSAPWPC